MTHYSPSYIKYREKHKILSIILTTEEYDKLLGYFGNSKGIKDALLALAEGKDIGADVLVKINELKQKNDSLLQTNKILIKKMNLNEDTDE